MTTKQIAREIKDLRRAMTAQGRAVARFLKTSTRHIARIEERARRDALPLLREQAAARKKLGEFERLCLRRIAILEGRQS